jgi:hypothetical protein
VGPFAGPFRSIQVHLVTYIDSERVDIRIEVLYDGE